MQPVYLRHHVALLSLLRVSEREREKEKFRVWNVGVRPDFRDLIFLSLLDAYKMYGCTRVERKMENEKESEKEGKRQTDRGKKDAMPFNKPPLRDWRGFRRKGNTGVKASHCTVSVRSENRRKRSRGDHLHFWLKTNWRSIEDQSKTNWEPNAERASCRFARAMLKGQESVSIRC